jgi:hypothetical protein
MESAAAALTCYAQASKAKSRLVLEAFAAGCGARMATTDALVLEPGGAVFYGVRPGWVRLWMQAKAEGRDVWYIDNAFFDDSREQRFRVAKNCVQLSAFRAGDYPRFGRPIAPWRTKGEHVVVCAQTTEFMSVVAGWTCDWAEHVCHALRKYTTRPLIIRRKGDRRSLAEALKGAWALVAHTSAAANEALVAGVPVFCTGECAASAMGSSDLSRIEQPSMPDGREQWAAAVAAHQWTLDELRLGKAWKRLMETQ